MDRTHDLVLSGSMAPYRWTLNGKTFPDTDPLQVEEVDLDATNPGQWATQLPQTSITPRPA